MVIHSNHAGFVRDVMSNSSQYLARMKYETMAVSGTITRRYRRTSRTRDHDHVANGRPAGMATKRLSQTLAGAWCPGGSARRTAESIRVCRVSGAVRWQCIRRIQRDVGSQQQNGLHATVSQEGGASPAIQDPYFVCDWMGRCRRGRELECMSRPWGQDRGGREVVQVRGGRRRYRTTCTGEQTCVDVGVVAAEDGVVTGRRLAGSRHGGVNGRHGKGERTVSQKERERQFPSLHYRVAANLYIIWVGGGKHHLDIGFRISPTRIPVMEHTTNLAILTQSHKAIAAKRRKKNSQIKELVFDEDARREFLTGFHKRKLAKKEEAKKRAILREKQQRLEWRRERRRALAERAAQNAAEVEKACGAIVDDDDDAGEDVDDDASEIGEEYEGEEQLATVTVVEDFDPAALIIHEEQEHHPKSRLPARGPPSTVEGTPNSHQQANSTARNKSKKRSKVKYQTKAERTAERAKQRARRTEKAERAGGKASRKKKRR